MNRRDCLSGGAALAFALATRLGRASASTDLRATLDALQADLARSPRRLDAAEALSRLADFDAATLSPTAMLDLQVIRATLDAERRLQSLPGGGNVGSGRRQRYALQLQRQYGAPVTPVQAHARLESECRRLVARADRLLRALGLVRGPVGDRFLSLAADPRWRYDDDDAGRDRAVADMNRWLEHARGRVPVAFPGVPSWCLDVRVRRLTAAEVAAARPGFRVVPTASAPGAYVVDLRDIDRRPSWSLPSVVHHELLPGHLLQLPLEAAAGAHPLRVQMLGTFTEAWATYAEEQAAVDAPERDASRELGLLHWLLFRALRGLADTGLHHAGWTRGQALQRLRTAQGMPAYFASFAEDVERIERDPGVRAAEALQWLGLRQLRDRAARRIGVRAYHGMALRDGRMPIPTLAARIG